MNLASTTFIQLALKNDTEKYFDVENRMGVAHECDRETDGQTNKIQKKT